MELSIGQKYYRVRDGSFVVLIEQVGENFKGEYMRYSAFRDGGLGLWKKDGCFVPYNGKKFYLDIIEECTEKDYKKHKIKVKLEQAKLLKIAKKYPELFELPD